LLQVGKTALQTDLQRAIENNAVLAAQLDGVQEHGSASQPPPVPGTAVDAQASEIVAHTAEPVSEPVPQG
jgi:hypothetical protein